MLAWKQRDKISTSWLLALPGSDSQLSNEEFSEAAAANLCLPSPACVGRVGEGIRGRSKVDLYGDAVQSSALPGDHWRKRHDLMKNTISRLCQWAALPCDVEVYNIFARHIPQAGLSRIDKDRDRQGLVPDLRINLTIGGESRAVLHEIKVISSNPTRYKPSMKQRGVDLRAEQLPQEYLKKARKVDQLHGGCQPGNVGKVEQKLLSFPKVEGLVFGNWGEASEATHRLVEALATSRARVADPQSRGKRGNMLSEEGIKGLAVGFIRRKLSVASVKAQALSLIGRLEGIGPAAITAAGRRTLAAEQERHFARERKAYALATRHGLSFMRKGFAKLD